MNIVGAGLSGLIAAHIWPQARIYEIAPTPMEQHKALLRFRSDVVAQVTGIEFKRVKVRKGVWTADHGFVAPSIYIANQYSQKCLGRIEPERSIWNVEPCERFIAPDDFYQQLLENCAERISWGHDFDFDRSGVVSNDAISTIPLPVLLNKIDDDPWNLPVEFNRAPITVQRFRIKNCEAYQTVYFPDAYHSVYRASITGETLIVEHADSPFGDWRGAVGLAFGIDLHASGFIELGAVEQKYGKIVPIEDSIRKSILFDMTHKYGIYSLGRFATWRNILLDDVVGDAAVIKRLMRGDRYDLLKEVRK